MDIATLMRDFRDATQVSFDFEPGGQVALEFADGVEVALQHDIELDLLYVYRKVGKMPDDPATRYLLLERLFLANGFDPATRAGAIAYDADARDVLLVGKLPVRWATPESLGELISNVLRDAADIAPTLGAIRLAAVDAASAPTPDAGASGGPAGGVAYA